MKVVTSDIMREIDRRAIEEFSIPAVVLMNNAGKSVADFIISRFKKSTVYIFCGTGNNGGDGFTAAFYLFNAGFNPVIYISGKKEKISSVSLIFLDICEKHKIPITYITEENFSSIEIKTNSLIIDALTGTGFNGRLTGVMSHLVNFINTSDSPIISVDIPSGIPSDGHTPEGDFVRSDYTITMGLPKISLVTYPCKNFCGELIVADIGFPAQLTSDREIKTSLIEKDFVKSSMSKYPDDDIHKGNKGISLIVGGFDGMEGAALLSATAMFRTGTGLVTIATSESARHNIAGKIPEVMTFAINKEGSNIDNLFSKGIDTLLIGPGLGRGDFSEKIFYEVMNSASICGVKNIIIDGDGLFFFASYIKNNGLSKDIDYIITPHFMEASRIMSIPVEEIRSNRYRFAIELAQKTGCITLLKGPASIVTDGEFTFINTSGNRALATAGSGDVLSGIIAALVNRVEEPLHAVCDAVFIHGLCASLWSEEFPKDSMSSSDIIHNIPKAIKKILNNQ
ncbi:MAG TPA: NAD(P)H-hydrate dehydratase [Spirochaetota bacterium]|jgi:NAD(P)H-hydrate epimerase|nr:MAG: Bifunctional NAD(P)H-hydrate repair enzyme Nnr [Spirochaetes bacterium ADurb.Bin218]HON15690.1 NAD(P)H-hydrate dehydratase [Spirochaetota bacterium]HOQ12845.1 NAD(P)H-hydrate dehydratase [Spirochaetota bacterium]